MATGGFEAGKAFLQVLPSFDQTQLLINKFVAGLRPIDIPVNLDPKGLSKELDKALTKATKDTSVDLGKPKVDWTAFERDLAKVGKGATVPVTVDADLAVANAKLAELTARSIAVLAKVDADMSALREKLLALQTETPKIGVDVDLQKARAEAELAALEAKRVRVQLQVDADVARARADLAEVNSQVDRLDGKTANVNVESSSASRAIGIMTLLTAGIAAAGFAAPAAAAAIAAIPAALSVAGQGVATLLVAFSGIGDAVKAYQAVDDDSTAKATSNAKSRASSANQIASATSALQSAQTQADRAAITGAEQVQAARDALARAQDGLAQAQEAALRRVQDAERSLTSAQQSARDAQVALNRAREDAAERLEDLQIALKGSALDEESAALALEKAQAKLAKLQSAGVTGPDLHEADLSARQAAQSLLEVQERYADLQKEATNAAKSGIEGDTAVLAAHRQVRDSSQRVADAERNLTEARTDGARQVAQAQAQFAQASQAVAQAQERAAWAQADAVKSVADAQRNLAAATASAGVDGTAAMDKLHLALSKLTPEGRSFATFLQREVKPALIGIGDGVQAALLPRLEGSLRTLLQLTPYVSQALNDTARVIGDLAVKGADMVTSGPWKRDFATVASTNVDIIRALGEAGLDLADAFRNILVSSGPMLKDFANIAARSAETFAAFIQGKRDSGELALWFHDMSGRLRELWEILSTVGGAVWDLAAALAPFGGALLHIVEALAKLISAFTEANPGLTTLIAGLGLAVSAFILFGRAVSGVIGAFASGRKGFGQLADGFRSTKDNLDRLSDSTNRFSGTAGALANPVSTLGSATRALSAAYKEGADRARAASAAHKDAAGPLTVLNRAYNDVAGSALRFADRAVVAATTTAGAFKTAFSDTMVAAVNRVNQVMERVATAAYDVGPALRTGVVRASLELDNVLGRVSASAGRTQEALRGGLIPTALAIDSVTTSATSAVSRLGESVRYSLAGAAIVANDALTRVGTTLRTGVLKPLVDAQAAYRATSTSVREFGTAQAALSAPLGQSQTLMDRVKSSFTSFSAVAAGAGAGLSAGFAAPIRVATEATTGLRNVLSSGLDKALTAVSSGITGLGVAASGAANVVKTGLSKAAGGLSDVLGGPWGIAITGAVLGLGLLATASDKAAQAQKEQQTRVDNLARALRDSKGAIDDNVRALAAKDLQDAQVYKTGRNVLQYARDLGISLPKITDGYVGNIAAQQELLAQLENLVTAGTSYIDTESGKQESQTGTAQSASVLKSKLQELFGTQSASIDQNKLLATATGETADKTKLLTTQQVIAKTTSAELNEKLATIADTTRDVATRGQAVIDFLDKLNGKTPTVEEAATRINADLRRLADGFKDANGNLISFRDGFLDANGLIDTTTQAGADLQGVVKSLGVDMASAGTAAFDQAKALGKSLPEAYKAATDAMDPYVGRVTEALRKNGLTEDQIARLLGQYNLVPPEIATTILLSGDKVASKQVTDVLGQLKSLPPDTPVQVSALTGVAEQSLIALGYHIVGLPDGSFKVFSNTEEGQRQADAFVAANNGRPINMEVALQTQRAEAALADFKAKNGDMALKPFISGNGSIHYQTPDGKIAILGSNLKYEALGGILKFFADGGFSNLNPMSANVASVVPPNTMRVIGDRAHGDEAFIPINSSPRSIAILTETAARMGYALAPLAIGGILAMATGGMVAPADPASPAAAAAPSVAMTPDQVDALAISMTAMAVTAAILTTALITLQATTIGFTTTGLTPMADQVNSAVVPALDVLMSRLPPVRDGFAVTTNVVNMSMTSMATATNNAVAQIGGYLATLRYGLQITGQSFQSTSDWARDSWARIRGYAADPSRDVLNIFNSGLITAWNFLDSSFGLNKHLNPVAIPFASGGFVSGPGTGTSDDIYARLSNGEFVVPAKIVKRTLPFLEALRSGQAEALQAAGYATGGLVADTGSGLNARLLKAQQFAQAQQGKPYIWGGVGPIGFDCSGLMSAITNVVRDMPNPYQRVGTAASAPWPGFVRGLSSAFAMGSSPTHTAGTLGGINVESTGNHVRFGGDAHGADDRQFPIQSSLPIVGGQFVSGGGGGVFDPTAAIAAAFADTRGMISQVAARYPGNMVASQGTGIASYASTRLQQMALDKISTSFGSSEPGSGPVHDQVRAVAARYGWGDGPQWNALEWLVQHESSWNPTAQNPTSTAFGLFQFLDQTWGNYGATKTSNPGLQAEAGMRYIQDRYTDPLGAQRFWGAHHWYDDGGWLPPGFSTVGNHTGKPEAVLTQEQWNSLTTLAGVNPGGGGRSITVNARTDASPVHIAHTIDRHLSIGARL